MRRPPFPQRMGVTIMHFNGLTDKQVEESRKKYGSNVIPDSEPTTFWAEFKETFKDPMIRILLAIAALMIVMCVLGYAEIYEPIGTVVAVLIVAFVSAKTGVASDTKYRQLKDSTKKDQCKVYRNGLVTVIDVDDVVVGDKVLLQSGDKVPADGVLIHGTLRVDNSALNGEAEECPKTAADESFPLPEDITGDTFVDAHSLFRGAVLFDGEGVLDVRKVGLATMMGKMAEEMQDDEPDSPLKVKLGKLADMISRFGYIGAVVIAIMYFGYFILSAGGFAAYFSSGAPVIIQDIVEAVSLAVVIIVCAVPEGLPLMISLVLMQNTSKMLDHNVLVRKAEGIETAGSLNILFSDKTGTITKGHLEVVEFFTADGVAIPLDQLAQQTKLKGLIDLAIGKNSQSMYDGSGRVVGGKIVILDDNFKSIKDAIWYGRTIYHNILKFCRFQLVINVAAVVVSAIAPFFGVEEPLKVTHLLFVNLVMDGLGAIMLGNEPAQERYMSEPPRRRDESIVSKSMMAQIVTMGLWLTALSFVFLKVPFFDSFFASTEQKLSAYFVLFIWSALFNAFNVRSDSFDIFKDLKLNPGFMRVFVIIVLVQAFIVNAALIPVPVFGWISNMFSCVPFPPAGWAAAILLAFTMIPVDILRKVIVGRK